MALSEAEMLKEIMENISHPNIMHIDKVQFASMLDTLFCVNAMWSYFLVCCLISFACVHGRCFKWVWSFTWCFPFALEESCTSTSSGNMTWNLQQELLLYCTCCDELHSWIACVCRRGHFSERDAAVIMRDLMSGLHGALSCLFISFCRSLGRSVAPLKLY